MEFGQDTVGLATWARALLGFERGHAMAWRLRRIAPATTRKPANFTNRSSSWHANTATSSGLRLVTKNSAQPGNPAALLPLRPRSRCPPSKKTYKPAKGTQDGVLLEPLLSL